MTMASIPFLIPHVRSKALRPLAVTSIQRMALLPEVPTMVEAGFAGFVVTQWNGVVIPAGTPGSLVARLQGEIARALRHPEVSSRVASDGTEVVASTPREFGAFLRSEHETWLRVVKQAGIRGD
jgi:tripartite-type tricarboxylate transporter receptor subunit TctC